MITGSVIVGSGDPGMIVLTPPEGRLNLMVSTPGVPLALIIACRKEPAPPSFVLKTMKVVAADAGETRRLQE